MKYVAVVFAFIFILVGCTTEEEKKPSTKTEEIKPLTVNIVIYPSPIEVNKEVTVEAAVTQGNEMVADAENVEFELSIKGEESYKKIDGVHQGDGVYSINESFAEVGTYQVRAHVTARDLHAMPQREFDVVDLQLEQEEQPAPDPNGHHHHGSDVLIHLMTNEEITSNKETELKAHISYQNAPLQGANVRFEVWKEGEEAHEFVDATEISNGEYAVHKIFAENGTYNINVHVKNDEIHDHKLETIIVK